MNKKAVFLIKLATAYLDGSKNEVQLILLLEEFLKILKKQQKIIEF